MEMTEIKNMNKTAILAKIQELKKQMFDHRQKLLQGELKNYNIIKVMRRDIARLLTELPNRKDEPFTNPVIKQEPLPEPVKTVKKEKNKTEKAKAEKPAKPKKEKVKGKEKKK